MPNPEAKAERDRCVALMRLVPWWYFGKADGLLIGKCMVRQVEDGVPADKAWTLIAQGHAAIQNQPVQIYNVKRERRDDLGIIFQPPQRDTWTGKLRWTGRMEPEPQKDGLATAYDAAMWVAETHDRLQAEGTP